MARRDLKLNSLGRFGKQSDRLILEEHGHCEVPAGCGGAVLRWRNPSSGLLFLVKFFSTCKADLLIDGLPLSSGLPLISFGNHVISIACSEIESNEAMIAFAAIHDETEFGFPAVSHPSGQKLEILSAADGSWKCSTFEPVSDVWKYPGFDDSNWSPMTIHERLDIDQKDTRYYRLKRTLDAGASCLGVNQQQSRGWIRKAFTVIQHA